jgi:hypothetical protein
MLRSGIPGSFGFATDLAVFSVSADIRISTIWPSSSRANNLSPRMSFHFQLQAGFTNVAGSQRLTSRPGLRDLLQMAAFQFERSFLL